MKAKFAYVPHDRGAIIETDANLPCLSLNSKRREPKGRLLVTVDGSDPQEDWKEALEGRHARRITRARAIVGFGKRAVADLVAAARTGIED